MQTIDDLKALQKRFFQAINNDKVLLQRCNAYCYEKKQKALIEFLSSADIGLEHKIAMMEKLISFVEKKDYSELPQSAAGQASESTPTQGPVAATRPVASAPKPAPAPPAPAVSAADKPAAAAPAVSPAVAALAEKVRLKRAAEADAAVQAAAAAKPTITKEEIIQIVREHTMDEEQIRALILEVCRSEIERSIAALAASL